MKWMREPKREGELRGRSIDYLLVVVGAVDFVHIDHTLDDEATTKSDKEIHPSCGSEKTRLYSSS
jgi:hypothetical protein